MNNKPAPMKNSDKRRSRFFTDDVCEISNKRKRRNRKHGNTSNKAQSNQ